MSKTGMVSIVGAGCGSADLITVRGLRRLESCDVVIYDDLIDPALLAALPAGAEKIYMGKRSGHHSAPQEEINAALIAKAAEGKKVVRLKGGDPFVFGRGGEEAEALFKAGIPYEEIPGISSSIAIPASAGIPVTHRGLSRSFHVITAHTADTADGLPDYMDTLAQLPGTLVFLMGLSKLELIASRLISAGMPPQTPAAVISGGNSPNPAAVRAPLADIAQKTRLAGVRPPAVIVIGKTAALDLSSTLPQPLAGVKIALTGTDAISGKLEPQLVELGAEVYHAQRSDVVELETDFDFSALSEKRCTVIFTSGNGVRLFFKKLYASSDIRALASCRFAVIGAATKKELRKYGITADLCPEEYTSEALGRLLLERTAPDEELYLFRSSLGSQELYDALSAKRCVHDVHLYTLRSDPLVSEAARGMLSGTDYICFSSASGVQLFLAEHKHIPESAACVCIGGVTAAELEKHTQKPFLHATDISAEGIISAILAHHAGDTLQ